jgi:hypothetical protein
MDERIKQNGHEPQKNNETKTKWTVMVYLAGDNNLTANCISVLQQLEAVRYNRDVCVLACFDSNTPWPKGSRYLAINCKWRKADNDLDWEIHNDLIVPRERDHDLNVPDFCRGNHSPKGEPLKRTGVAEGLKRFLHWSMKNHDDPDRRYMLILFGHGPVVAGKTFLARDNPQSSLSLQELPELLGEHFGPDRKLDILACQNCVMNGIETAYAVKDQVDYMIGSQGLVLSNGWPYEKLISALVDDPGASTAAISEKVLKLCARHMIDFAVMDRSSEQSVCDLGKLREPQNLTVAISELSRALTNSLGFKRQGDQLVLTFPAICDAVRLARLEAQSYWGETFVDIYDFCERLLKKCKQIVLATNDLLRALKVNRAKEREIRHTPLMCNLRQIIECCKNVLNRVEEIVPHSYYICSDLQYSHGVSIYFPWSMPVEPYTFEQSGDEYTLITAFQTYSDYSFVADSGWDIFLKAFYGATLRKVRRAERDFVMLAANASLSRGMVSEEIRSPGDVYMTDSMRKTDSDHGSIDYSVWSNVKNYPRRNYVSPSDCDRRIEHAGRQRPGRGRYRDRNSPPVSYLGWNICELVAEVIKKPPSSNGKNNKQVKVPAEKGIKKRLPPGQSRRQLEGRHA